MKKAFTTVELMVAVAVMAFTMAGVGVIFKISIEAYRTANATAEVMRKLRAITDQLDADFRSLQKDGYLLIRSVKTPPVFVWQGEADNPANLPREIHRDNMVYFSTGDFQTMTEPYLRSNIALIYVGPYDKALNGSEPFASQWVLLRRATLLCPAENTPRPEYWNISFARIKTIPGFSVGISGMLDSGYAINIADPNENWQYFSGGVGSVEVKWTDGTRYPDDNSLVWFGLEQTRADWENLYPPPITPIIYAGKITEELTNGIYTVQWKPANQQYWPKALRFTFTLYDSRGVLKKGMTFTHIVYLSD